MKAIYKTIAAYNRGQTPGDQLICEILEREIHKALPDAQSKIWHGSPVWFLESNPIVGYHRLKDGIRLLFWSGQSFKERDLHPEGSFKAAEARLRDLNEINVSKLRRWLVKSKNIQWDYKNIIKRKGKLIRLPQASSWSGKNWNAKYPPATSVGLFIKQSPLRSQPKLKQLRRLIKTTVPQVVEGISYRMPVYKFLGKQFVGFAGYEYHIGFYPMSGSFLGAFKQELKGYVTSKGAVQFPLDKPLPTALIKKMLKRRQQEIQKIISPSYTK